ncbi:Chitin synthase, partial [Hortaea werneckii]
MASNNPWGYGPPPGYSGEDEGTPSGPQSHNGSTMRLLTSSDEPEFAQPTPTRSPYNPFARSEDYQLPNPVQADDSDLSSLLRDVESDLSSNPRPSAPRTKTAKVRFKNKDKDSNVSSAPSEHQSQNPFERTYDPTEPNTSRSRQTSVLDNAPQMPPPTDMPAYMPYRPSSRGSSSPTRPLSPLRNSTDYARPPASSNPYEPADINGAPRPGTPSTQYGGSPRRPLPPQPLFAAGRPPSFDIGRGEEADMTSIPIDGDEDPFGPPTRDSEDTLNGEEDEHGQRPGLKQHDSFVSQSTFTDSLYDEKDEELYGPAPSGKQARRGVREAQMSKKEVQLINGELILECKIPTILYSFLPR